MLTKARVKNMLSKQLSGKEAGRLWLMDSWEVDRGREGFLSEAELTRLRKNLTTPHDITEFNNAIELLRYLEYTIKDAQTAFLQASIALKEVSEVARAIALNWLAIAALNDLPLIVTEKQFQKLKAQQKRERKKKLHCLEEVYEVRAATMAEEETGLYFEDVEEAVWDTAWTRAVEQIDALIKSRKLRPQKLDIRADTRGLLEEDGKAIAYSPPLPEETPEEQERLLGTGFSGQELAKAGLPEWIKDIEEFRTYRIGKENWYGDEAPEGVAVIQEDLSNLLVLRDVKDGVYTPVMALRHLRDASGLEQRYRGANFTDLLETLKHRISVVIALRQVLREAAPLVGVNTAEDVDRFYESLQREVDFHNKLTGLEHAYERVLSRLPSMEDLGLEPLIERKPIELEKIKPDGKSLRFGRGLLAEHFGKNWWSQPVEAEEGNDHAE